MAKYMVAAAEHAAAKCNDGMHVMISGFAAAGSPNRLCRASADAGIMDINIIANGAGNGIGTFLFEKRAAASVSHVSAEAVIAENEDLIILDEIGCVK